MKLPQTGGHIVEAKRNRWGLSAFHLASGVDIPDKSTTFRGKYNITFKHGSIPMKTLLLTAAVIASVGSAWAQDGMKQTTVMPEALTWKDNPAIPKGGQIAIR